MNRQNINNASENVMGKTSAQGGVRQALAHGQRI